MDAEKQLLRGQTLMEQVPPQVSAGRLHSPATLDDEGEDGVSKGGGGLVIDAKGGKMHGAEAAPLLSPTEAAAAKAAAAGVATDLQKKLQRAERFGMPIQLSEEEKRNSRAERFGMGSTTTIHGKSEELKRKARAERFGLAASPAGDEEEKKKARLARFGQAPAPNAVEQEKRQARAARFSQTAPSESDGQKKAVDLEAE